MQWQIGDVRITRVRETDLNDFTAQSYLRVERRDLDPYRSWLEPYLGARDELLMSVHAFGIEADGLRIVVDTCIGNDKQFGPGPFVDIFNGLHTSFLDDLTRAGFGRDAVDLVVCTHLHVDHVGWNTVKESGVWVPTFRRARYVMSKGDLAHWSASPGPLNPFEISVQPLVARGLVDAADSEFRLSKSVSLWPSPGHTPGHVSVRIESRGEVAMITGDMVHTPVQLARPEWSSIADTDAREAEASRHRLLREVGGGAALVLGTHFPGKTAGRVLRDGSGWRFV
jgi:glyoxylase-like metal-dependent hydrolase (beta-lactamase superfamily II)